MSQIIGASNPKLDFEKLIEQVALTNEPIFIRGNNDNTAVLISETMWKQIQDYFDTINEVNKKLTID
jgi:PHD/YefM family antitoxin component YafN of YafNO toxin-antitoxin module